MGSHVSDAFWVKGGQLGSRLVFHGFSWFQVGFSVCVLYSGPTIQSRPCRPKAGFGLVPIKKLRKSRLSDPFFWRFLVISELGSRIYMVKISDFDFLSVSFNFFA